MANGSDNTSRGCIFHWKIENISHCWLKKGIAIESPKFIADALHGTKWLLKLIPLSPVSKGYMAFYLRRDKDCVGPDSVTIYFEIAVLDKDGTSLQKRKKNWEYSKNSANGFSDFEKRDKVFITHREAFLPKDTLTVQLTIWNTDQKPAETEHLYARTTFNVNRRNFMCRIENFSSLKSNKKHAFKDSLIEFDLVLKEGLEIANSLVIIINSFDERLKYFSFKASIINSRGEMENSETQKYFEDDIKKGELCTVLFTKKVLENRSRYLPNDVLSLDCEYTCSNGTVLEEHYGCGIISQKITKELAEIVNENMAQSLNDTDIGMGKSETMAAMAKDLISMYNNQILSDIEIRTSTQAFPTHKNILSARSPVFRKMFSYDMKEKISGYVDIDDLEDDTVHRMLLYMYTDTLDDLQYESACKLYLAADKYEILSLRDSCSAFIKNNLCPNKACDVLVLADRHQDDKLKSYVQDFILKHDKEVFGLQEWKDFMNCNHELAIDIMYRFTLSKI